MRLLHGSNVERVMPNLKKCQSKNDFGLGFYLTPQWQRAYLMAKRRAGRDGGEPVITPFLFYPTMDKEIERHKQKYGTHYLDTEALLDFAEHVSQFGSKYVQYCFCTKEALEELIKE